jgi:hypothetical protein
MATPHPGVRKDQIVLGGSRTPIETSLNGHIDTQLVYGRAHHHKS